MHTEPRNGSTIDRIYLHTNEGPQGPNAAQNLAAYLATVDAGYHVIADDQRLVVCAGDDQVLWSQGGDNHHALSICFIGYAAFDAADWATPYSTAMGHNAAKQVAAWCKAYAIPVVHVAAGAPGQAPTARGIAEHADDHDPSSQGHTDPGTSFPMDAFLARVNEALQPATDWAAIARLALWLKNVTAENLQYGQTRPGVIILKQLLARHGYHTDTGPFYGGLVSRAVAQEKAKAGLRNRLGEVVGEDFARHLLGLPSLP